MPRFSVLFAILVSVALCAGDVAANASNDRRNDPFAAAAYVPADVDAYLHVSDAATLRAELADRPLADWFRELFDAGQMKMAWNAIAAQSRLSPAQLFDRCLGEHVTFIKRAVGEGENTIVQWALITEMPPRRMTRLLERLEPRALRPRHNAALFELPEHELLLARRDNRLLVAPASKPALLMAVLDLLSHSDGERLSATEAFAELPELSNARLGAYKRHAPPMGGWSLAAANLDGDRIRLQHAARFDASPFSRQVTNVTIDASPLELLKDHALVAVIEPTDIGGSPLETFFLATIGEGLLSGPMQRGLGDRRIIVLGEIEGRQEDAPIDLQAPTIAVGYEMAALDDPEGELNRQMIRLAERLNRLGGDRFELDVPSLEAVNAGERSASIDLSPLTQWLTGDLPLVQPVSLNWAATTGPNGTYCIIASHPVELRGILTAFEREPEPDAHDERKGNDNRRYQQCGVANGVRIAHHLESWIERAPVLAEPGREEEFQQVLRMFAALGQGMERVRWRIARPEHNRMELELTIRLMPPESTLPAAADRDKRKRKRKTGDRE